MPRLGSVEVVYKSTGLTQLRADVKDSEKAFKSGATAAAAYAIAIGTSIVKIGMPFEQMILDAGSAMRATEREMAAIETAARKAGATTEHQARAAAESLKFLGKAGLDAGQAMMALPGMMNFKTAIGDLMGLGKATDVITDSMTSMGLEVKDLTHLTDLFIGVSNRSSTDAAMVGETFSKVAGIARLYGMEVEDLTTIIGIQASAGIKSGIAGRQLKNAFANTAKAAAELGIKNEGLLPTLRAVEKAGWDADKIMSVYGKIALPTVAAMLNKISGTEKGTFDYLRNEMAHVSDGMGETAIQAEKMRSSVQNQLKIVTSQVEDLALSIYDNWKPAMLDAIKTTIDFLKENKTMLIGMADALKPVLLILGVGGTMILGLKALAIMTPLLAGAFATLSESVAVYATTNASAITVLNTQLFGVSLSARAATGAIGVLTIAAGALFAAFAGWQIGKYLYDQFEFARVWGVHFVSTLQRGFIELQFAGEYTWMAIKNASIAPMKFMLESFKTLTDIATSTMGALGQTEEQTGFAKMSMDINNAVREMDAWAGSIDDVAKRKKSALEIHNATVDAIYNEAKAGVTWAEQMAGHNDNVTESKKKQDDVLADLRNRQTAAQISDLNKISIAEIAAADERAKAQEDFFQKSGMMSKEMYQARLKELDAEITRFRLAGADELQITKWKNDEISKLNKQYSGQTTKQLASDGKAREKALDKALKDEFGFLDEREKAVDKAYRETVKQHEKMLKEILKLEESQIKDFEKTLGDSQKAYEDFLKDKLGVKELSAESLAEIDREYARIFDEVSAGEVDSFGSAMTDILNAKFENTEALKENDALYSAYLREQAIANKDIRLEFYSGAGRFSEEYYASEVQRINEYTEKLRKAGVDAVDIEREKTAQMRELDIKKLESSDSFFAGLSLSLEKSKGDLISWADVGEEIGNTFQKSLSGTISTAINSIFEPADTSELEAQLKDLQSQYDAYAKKIIEVDNAIAASGKQTQDAIREANRKTMTDYELFQDDKLRYAETIADAEKAILDENFELAAELYEEARGIAATLQREVKDETAAAVNEIADQFSGLQTTFDDLENSIGSFGKESQTALSKSAGIFNSISSSAKNFGKDIDKINIAAALGDPKEANKIAKAVIKNYGEIFKAGESSINDLMGEWDDYYEKIESNEDKIKNIHMSTDDKIRELMRGTMDEQELYNDRRLEYDETYAEATRALQEGNYEYAAELFEESIGLAEKLADDSVGTLEENTAIAIDLMNQASTGATDAMTAHNTSMAESMSDVENAISSTSEALGDVTDALSGLDGAGNDIVSSLEENTAIAIDLMAGVGKGAADALILEQEALEKNITDTEIAMGDLSGKISEKSRDIETDWGDLWSGMLQTVTTAIANMVAAWAAETLTNAAITGAGYLAGLAGYEDGVYNFQPSANTPPAGNGGFLSILHPGESVLTEEQTQDFINSTGWPEARASVLDSLGIDSGDTDGFLDTVGDYSGAGKALYDSWMAFRDGDNTAGSIALANAFEKAFTTYAANAGSQSAANIAGGLGGAAGAIGSGIGAWQSFQNEDYASGITQTLQTAQQAAAAYQTLTASTINTTSTASIAAAENAAASGAGSLSNSLGDIIEGAGYGGAIWSIFNMIAGDEHMQSSIATTMASTGAIIGASLGTALAGPYGSTIGGFFGAAIGGLAGTVIDVASGPDARFEVDDLNGTINSARTWTSDGWAGSLNPAEGDTGSAHGNARNTYLQATQASMDMATATVASVYEMLGPEIGEQFSNAFAANIDPVAAEGGNWQIGEEGRGSNTAARLAATYWNDTMDALSRAAYSIAPSIGEEADLGNITNPLSLLGMWAMENMVPDDVLIDPTGQAQLEERSEIGKAWAIEQEQMRQSGEIGSAATGGVVATPNESGFLDVTTGEGIFSVPAMKWAEDIGKMIEQGGLFGGQFPEFDKPVEQQQEIVVTFPDDVGRSNVFSELYLSDVVTNTTGANERLDRIIERLEEIVGINREIASKPVPHISADGLVNMVAGPLQDGAQSGRYVFNSREVLQAARITINNPRIGW